jgi:hypothetical protein
MQLHPIMYVADQYAERSFYELFGFERTYEGKEFPGFLAIRHGEAIIGLQRASPRPAALHAAHEVDEIIATCRQHGLQHEGCHGTRR